MQPPPFLQHLTLKTIFHITTTYSPPLPPLSDGGGGGESGLSHLSKHLHRRDLGQLEILGSKSFFRWDLKTLCIKNSEYESQAKKNDSDINCYNFSLLVPLPNKFPVVFICILIFHGIYSPYPKIFFVGD